MGGLEDSLLERRKELKIGMPLPKVVIWCTLKQFFQIFSKSKNPLGQIGEIMQEKKWK